MGFGTSPQVGIQGGGGGLPGQTGEAAADAPKVDTSAGFTPEEDIVFTDPDNPEASLPELSEIITDPKQRKGAWEKSIVLSKRMSARQGRPLLIWFTDSARSPLCKSMSDELLSKGDFQTWAEDHLIRLRVDESEMVADPDRSLAEIETMRTRHRAYVNQLRKQYKVLGYPSLVLLGPDGKVQAHYRGYERGQPDYTWGLLKQGVAVADRQYQEWMKGLEKKGYRRWTDRQGRNVFAKLISYRDGMLTLIEPDGTRSRTSELKLSDADRLWIVEQKRLRSR